MSGEFDVSFILADLEFRHKRAGFSGAVVGPVLFADDTVNYPEEFVWKLFVWPNKLEVGGKYLRPSFWYEGLSLHEKDWRTFEGKRFSWTDPQKPWREDPYVDPYSSLPMCEEMQILDAEILFASRDGLDFEVEWSGHCVIRDAPHPYDGTLPFSIKRTVCFGGVNVSRQVSKSAAEPRKTLSKYLNPDDFVLDESAPHIPMAFFTPKP